jgi:tripartite-type tricarboxylate transporter receptor subunit TctC
VSVEAKRIKALPDVPTFAELGMPGVHLDTWFGLATPANTPPAIVNRLSAALGTVLKSGELSKRLVDLGAAEVPGVGTPEDFAAFWKKEIDRYRDLIKLSGATVE